MKRMFFSLIAAVVLSFVVVCTAHSGSNEAADFAVCERIKRQSICEEYRLSTLSDLDRQLIAKHCTTGERCPDNDRIGRCIRYKDPDGLVFDKHFYQGSKKKHDWNAATIEETCVQHNGKFENG